ncbi:hypothetical protein [Frigoribacterium sp. UYMn621]|uniref:hypothetical protein n=1 Tax=Frigoribacterium sp. UYMn621 TaxID=3156343 RepID=UPI003392484A
MSTTGTAENTIRLTVSVDGQKPTFKSAWLLPATADEELALLDYIAVTARDLAIVEIGTWKARK